MFGQDILTKIVSCGLFTKTVLFYRIRWDTQSETVPVKLPKRVRARVDMDFDPEEDGPELLSSAFGWCVDGFRFRVLSKWWEWN